MIYDDIFVKAKNEIDIESISAMIPKNSTNKENKEKQKTMTEWRWRFMNIDKIKVEISYKEPNKKRKYLNNDGEWIDANIMGLYYRFLIMDYFHYS